MHIGLLPFAFDRYGIMLSSVSDVRDVWIVSVTDASFEVVHTRESSKYDLGRSCTMRGMDAFKGGKIEPTKLAFLVENQLFGVKH